jgi:transposase
VLDLLNLPGVKPVDLRTGNKAIIVIAEVLEGDPPLCPECGKPLYRHGRRTNVFADTPMQMQPVRLEISRPRYRCSACGTMVVPELSFLDERRRATKRLVDAVRERCLGMTFHSLAEQTGLAVNTIKNIALDLIEDLERTVHYETPVIMGIDEVNLAGGMRCVITNLATNNAFQMLEFRTQEHLKPFFKNLPDKEKVEWVCTDMWRPFKRSFSKYLPNARLVIDKFHVVAMASEALETVRKKYPGDSGQDRTHQGEKVDPVAHLEAVQQPFSGGSQSLGGCTANHPRPGCCLRLQGSLLPDLRRSGQGIRYAGVRGMGKLVARRGIGWLSQSGQDRSQSL